MRNLLIIITFLTSFNTYAFKPENCGESLDAAIKIVLINDVLGNELDSEPGADYMKNGHPNLCISTISKNNKLFSWLIHKHVTSNVMIIEKINLKTFNKYYYGPFISNQEELKRHLIEIFRERLEKSAPFRSGDIDET